MDFLSNHNHHHFTFKCKFINRSLKTHNLICVINEIRLRSDVFCLVQYTNFRHIAKLLPLTIDNIGVWYLVFEVRSFNNEEESILQIFRLSFFPWVFHCLSFSILAAEIRSMAVPHE